MKRIIFYLNVILKNLSQEINNSAPGMEIREDEEEEGLLINQISI